MTNLLELMKCEEALLLIEKRHNSNDLELKFITLLKLKRELENIGKITDIYFKEIERKIKSVSDKEDKEQQIAQFKENLLQTELEYDFDDYKSIILSEEVQQFYHR